MKNLSYPVLIGALVGIFTILGFIFKWGKGIIVKIRHFIIRYRPKIPRETMRIIPQPPGHWWHMGSINKQPAMQLVSNWYVTNITNDPVIILGSRILRPRIDGHVFATQISKGATDKVSAHFWIQPPVCKQGRDFKAKIVLIDQFGNEHKIKNVLFKTPKKEDIKIEPIEEPLHSISNPIEKDIVSVLKDETYRYGDCGRSVGGLGSVTTVYKGQTQIGIGSEWRVVGSTKGQSIIPYPDEASIESDNAKALLNIYKRLNNDNERHIFVTQLLRRLSRNTEYAPIGYLILLVLFHIGRLPEALKAAKND